MPRPMTILAEGPQPGQKVSPISEQNVARGSPRTPAQGGAITRRKSSVKALTDPQLFGDLLGSFYGARFLHPAQLRGATLPRVAGRQTATPPGQSFG